ncbi:MAG: hypothetical protein IAI50_07125, partial [Candidatus Eremiobacteraeota bacterium]|nr:hypothetical protein [Candidatus Eremiobacteraeota bacterium]
MDSLRGPDAYIYVSDADEHKVYVYPVGVVDARPLHVISVPGIPGGMAVADNGNVFVAITNGVTAVAEVMIYSPGGT